MLEKELGKNLAPEQRKTYLMNICDGSESISYNRIFSPEEIAEQRELLTDASIMLADIESNKKQVLADFKEQAKKWEQQKSKSLENLRTKSELVTEECFKVLDEDSKTVGFYNLSSDLVYSRGASPKELQKTIFTELRKTGTDK